MFLIKITYKAEIIFPLYVFIPVKVACVFFVWVGDGVVTHVPGPEVGQLLGLVESWEFANDSKGSQVNIYLIC